MILTRIKGKFRRVEYDFCASESKYSIYFRETDVITNGEPHLTVLSIKINDFISRHDRIRFFVIDAAFYIDVVKMDFVVSGRNFTIRRVNDCGIIISRIFWYGLVHASTMYPNLFFFCFCGEEICYRSWDGLVISGDETIFFWDEGPHFGHSDEICSTADRFVNIPLGLR